jgi:hypothetical protein
MTSNFHHHHFQKIQGMCTYHFVTEQQDVRSVKVLKITFVVVRTVGRAIVRATQYEEEFSD